MLEHRSLRLNSPRWNWEKDSSTCMNEPSSTSSKGERKRQMARLRAWAAFIDPMKERTVRQRRRKKGERSKRARTLRKHEKE